MDYMKFTLPCKNLFICDRISHYYHHVSELHLTVPKKLIAFMSQTRELLIYCIILKYLKNTITS